MATFEEENSIEDAILQVAKLMVAAARTAPKARGESTLHTRIVTGSDVHPIIAKMEQISNEENIPSFYRDAQNLKNCSALILFGTSIKPLMLQKCGMCGFESCTEKAKHPEIPCVFNTGDLGIAIGSAVSVAMDHRIDNRIMYTVGQAVGELAIFPKQVNIIYGIPLQAHSKNIFFDRK
ncbi:MAG: DUF2148 domain-containing protein [Bacteroidales bacterium]|jgi:uncharacterized ferredoxin-like protein|nr:DUF2148 domain-containing protein [Bacteroidales bacterium]